MPLKTYLINLKSSCKRFERARRYLLDAGIEFQRYEAVDGRKAAATSFAEYNDAMARRRYSRPLSGGEVGCFLSHRGCVAQFLHTAEPYALVLEDDVIVPADFRDTLTRLVEWLDQSYRGKWDVVNLGNPPEKHFSVLCDFPSEHEGGRLCVAHYFPLGTFSLLWNREGAKSFLENSRTVYAPVDQFLRDWCVETGRGLAFTSPPIRVTRGESEIASKLSERFWMNWLSYWFFKNLRLWRNNRKARLSRLAFEQSYGKAAKDDKNSTPFIVCPSQFASIPRYRGTS